MAKKTFDEVVLFARTGLNPRNNFKLGNGDNKYITIKNIHDGELVIDDNTDVVSDEAINLIHKRSQIKKGDILFCSIGRIGDMYIIENEPEGWDINESVFAFTLNSDIIYQKYFYYIFKNQNTIRLISKNSSGSTFKSIKMNQIKKMVFELPPLEEQKKVINILDNLSLIIKNFEKELKKLDELTKARFVEMFGNPASNNKGWDLKLIEDCLTSIDSGKSFVCDSSSRIGNKPGILKLSAVTYGVYNPNENKAMINDNDFISAAEVHDGDLLFTRKNTPELVGMAAYVESTAKSLMMPDLIFRLNTNKNCNKIYLWKLINHELYRPMIIRAASGSAKSMSNISKERLGKIKIPLPPCDLQMKFANFVTQVDKSRFVIQKALDEAQLLFDSLMQEYFE